MAKKKSKLKVAQEEAQAAVNKTNEKNRRNSVV